MKQRINLYQRVKKRNSFDPLSFSGAVTIFTSSVAVLLLISVFLGVYANGLQSDVQQLRDKRQALTAEVDSEQARYQNLKVRPELEAEAERLTKEIAGRQQLLNFFQHLKPVQRDGFSPYLFGLAHSSQPESWLTGFTLDADKRQFVMHGGAVDGPAVPLMLEAIARRAEFREMRVGSLNVEALAKGVRFQANAELVNYE